MSSKTAVPVVVTEKDLAVVRAEHIGPDARIDIFLTMKEIDIALTTRREPDCEAALVAIKKFCKHYGFKVPKGYDGNHRTEEE